MAQVSPGRPALSSEPEETKTEETKAAGCAEDETSVGSASLKTSPTDRPKPFFRTLSSDGTASAQPPRSMVRMSFAGSMQSSARDFISQGEAIVERGLQSRHNSMIWKRWNDGVAEDWWAMHHETKPWNTMLHPNSHFRTAWDTTSLLWLSYIAIVL
jgi:hypothetical protein